MNARLNWFGAAFGFMLLLLVSVAVVSAAQQEGAKPAAAQETLTGTLGGDAKRAGPWWRTRAATRSNSRVR